MSNTFSSRAHFYPLLALALCERTRHIIHVCITWWRFLNHFLPKDLLPLPLRESNDQCMRDKWFIRTQLVLLNPQTLRFYEIKCTLSFCYHSLDNGVSLFSFIMSLISQMMNYRLTLTYLLTRCTERKVHLSSWISYPRLYPPPHPLLITTFDLRLGRWMTFTFVFMLSGEVNDDMLSIIRYV